MWVGRPESPPNTAHLYIIWDMVLQNKTPTIKQTHKGNKKETYFNVIEVFLIVFCKLFPFLLFMFLLWVFKHWININKVSKASEENFTSEVSGKYTIITNYIS